MNFATTKERILHFIDNQNIKVSDFLKKTDIKRGFLDSDKLNSVVSDTFLAKIIAVFPEISLEWLITGKGEMLKNSSETIREVPTALGVYHPEGIPLLPFDAFAGMGDDIAGIDFDVIEERYVIPLFDGIKIDFMIPVRGSSMYPKYSSGDVVACRFIKELLFFQWNKVYVLDTISQGVIMKRIKKSDDKESVTCISDNDKYEPFDIPMSDIRHIALVVGVIRLE